MSKLHNPEDLRNLTVLVVDDMVNMRRTMKSMLRYIGIAKFHEASDGEKALEHIKSGINFDLVIADWNMPSMHGLDLLRQVRKLEHCQKLPFIMVTAEISTTKIVQAAEESVNGYLLKPFVAKQLEEKIKHVLKDLANPTPFEKHMRTGHMLAESDSHDLAEQEYVKAIDLKPDSARARHAIGEMHRKAGNMDKAEKWLNQAIEKNPKFIKAHESLGETLILMGDENGALQSLERAGELNPGNPERQAKLGALYLERGMNDKADLAFKSAIFHSDHNAELHAEIGEVYLTHGFEDKAADAFSSSLGIIEDAGIYNRLGIALRRKGKFKEAENVYKKALVVEPNNEGIYYNFARLYLEQDKKSEAAMTLRKALAIAPDFEEAATLLKKVSG